MTSDVRKKGRPKSNVRKSRYVTLRLSEDEAAALRSAAADANLTVSAFVRSLSLEGAGVQPFLTPEDLIVFRVLHEDMRKVGINLNQVARALNSGRTVHPDELLVALRDVQMATDGMRVELRNLRVRGRKMRGKAS